MTTTIRDARDLINTAEYSGSVSCGAYAAILAAIEAVDDREYDSPLLDATRYAALVHLARSRNSWEPDDSTGVPTVTGEIGTVLAAILGLTPAHITEPVMRRHHAWAQLCFCVDYLGRIQDEGVAVLTTSERWGDLAAQLDGERDRTHDELAEWVGRLVDGYPEGAP